MIIKNMFSKPIDRDIKGVIKVGQDDDANIKGVISRALDNDYLNPNHEKECFDVNVLKTLFMIKYVKEIKANIENITSLMVSNVNDDRMALAQQVEDTLKRLVRALQG